MIPSPGRIVEYTLTEQDAAQVNRRRDDSRISLGRLTADPKSTGTGEQFHIGNAVRAGENYPLLITRVWGTDEHSAVNGQVLLDGNDTLWVTSAAQGEGERHWRPYPRV